MFQYESILSIENTFMVVATVDPAYDFLILSNISTKITYISESFDSLTT